MKFITFTLALSLSLQAFSADTVAKKKVTHDKEHHHTGTPDHEHDDSHHEKHDHLSHHPEHDSSKAVGEDEHAPKPKTK